VAVDDLGLVPEVLFLQADTFHAFDQAPGEKVGIGPQDLVDFVVQQFEIGRCRFDDGPGLLGRITGLVLTVDDLAVDHVVVGFDGGIADPGIAILDYRDAL
jgi:hypothetical protein